MLIARRQEDTKDTALPRCTLHHHRAAMQFGKNLDQIQAKARTLLGTPGVELAVFLIEPHKIPWGDTDTRILDGDGQKHVP